MLGAFDVQRSALPLVAASHRKRKTGVRGVFSRDLPFVHRPPRTEFADSSQSVNSTSSFTEDVFSDELLDVSEVARFADGAVVVAVRQFLPSRGFGLA